ncbi:hypothetical protein ACH4VR_40565 [Streptomyces sp. NPDC020883]|uniref:hypothetical protein n=1 Tax=Streptomyces sp. NPDC020883 TaxID=3365099 RepID=UPI0037B30BB0
MGKMLFSIPDYGWCLIAVAATAIFMIGIGRLSAGMKIPDELRSVVKLPSVRAKRVFYALAPVGLGVVLAINLIRSEPAPAVLFLYSVACISVPLAVVPVRGRLLKQYIAHQLNPGAGVKTDLLMTTWIVASLSAVMLVAFLALATTPYGVWK